jgi:hypothetical protein
MKPPTPSGDPSGGGTSGGGTSGGSPGGSIVWPEGLGSVGQYLVTAGKEFEKLVTGLNEVYSLPYTGGTDITGDNHDQVTWPFLKYFMSFKNVSEGLTAVTGQGIGARGYSTKVTDLQHGAAETTNKDNGKIFHG